MLLVIDVGNTNTVLGLFRADKLVHDWRIRTLADLTVDEYAMLLFNLFKAGEVSQREIKDIIISSVVPPLLNVLEPLCEKYFHLKPLVVGPGIKTGMPIFYDNPREVGADRIVNAIAGFEKYRQAQIIVDFGTATTFDYVSGRGEYQGGCIAPGIMIASDALFSRAAKLPRVELARPKSIIAKDTVSSMQAGIIFGYAGLVDGIIDRMKAEVKEEVLVLATGGLARVIGPETKSIQIVDDMLTLDGLRIIHRRNRAEG